MCTYLGFAIDTCCHVVSQVTMAKTGIVQSFPSEVEAPAATLAVGLIAGSFFALKAYNSESKWAKLGLGLLSIGSVTITAYSAYRQFLEIGCLSIYPEFKGCTSRKLSSCTEFINRHTAHIKCSEPSL